MRAHVCTITLLPFGSKKADQKCLQIQDEIRGSLTFLNPPDKIVNVLLGLKHFHTLSLVVANVVVGGCIEGRGLIQPEDRSGDERNLRLVDRV